jgi:hypothetical protein
MRRSVVWQQDNGRLIVKARTHVAPHIGLVLLLASCGSTENNDGCLVTELAHISAPSNLINLDDSVSLQASLVRDECLPDGVEPAEWRWSSSDALVVRVDSLTGVAQGVGLGTATILVHHSRSPGVQGTLDLRVVATAADVRRATGTPWH